MNHIPRSLYRVRWPARSVLTVSLMLFVCFESGHAQRLSPLAITDISSRPSAPGSVVTIPDNAWLKKSSDESNYQAEASDLDGTVHPQSPLRSKGVDRGKDPVASLDREMLLAQNIHSRPARSGAAVTRGQVSDAETSDTFLSLPLPVVFCLLLGLALGGLVMVRQRRARDEGWEDVSTPERKSSGTGSLPNMTDRRKEDRRLHPGRRASDHALETTKPVNGVSMRPVNGNGALSTNMAVIKANGGVSGLPELFGAYRVEQEVGKLVLGQPHRMDVLASRASDDRRAVEFSLLKSINSPEIDDDGRRRIRTALEEYGFVARQCATLLLGQSAYERTSAARILGEVGSGTALPFLLEALYDNEEIVRVQSVNSLGSLKLPSAIGALLDMARHHPEMPSELITRALNACSVDFFDIAAVPIEGGLPLIDVGPFSGAEITGLEPPLPIEELPESDSSDVLAELLAQLSEGNPEMRAVAARSLGDFRFRSVVARLTDVSATDAEANVRASAVTALATIDHETSFVPVLVALVDEAREVRAAAARALSSLSIDRADAYARVAQEASVEVQKAVALACVKSGIARQSIDRVASDDRRQAYEAFALLVILAKCGEDDLLMEAMGQNDDQKKAICTARVMAYGGRVESMARLRQLAVRDSITEDVRTAILEVIYKIDQAQPV